MVHTAEIKVGETKFRMLNINGVITAIPVEEIDRDLLEELSGR